MKGLEMRRRFRTEAGQSLVEVAIAFPILVLLFLGTAEVANLLITQNRVSASARAATGFAATNITGDEWENTDIGTGWPGAMAEVALQNVTEKLDLDSQRWDIWTVHAKLVDEADLSSITDPAEAFAEWVPVHAYGDGAVLSESDWPGVEASVQADVLEAAQEASVTSRSLGLVATVSYHDRKSFLGLNAFNFGAFTTIRGLNVMRLDDLAPYGACSLFPISIHLDNLSLYPENFAGTMVAGGEIYDPTDWESGQAAIVGDHDYNDNPYDHSGFPWAAGGHPLGSAMRGDIFEAREGEGPGNFGWLSWDGDTSATALGDSLTFPGNLMLQDPPPPNFVRYVNPYDGSDLVPGVGDWVQGSTGNINGVKDLADQYIGNGRVMQIIVYNDFVGTGSGFNYRIAAFVQVKLRARMTGTSDKRVLLEFMDWGQPCVSSESS